MNSFLPQFHPRQNALLQIAFLGTAGVWLIILLFSNYYSWNQIYQDEEVSCKLKYTAQIICKYNGKTMYKGQIDENYCDSAYKCNTILATYPITIIDLVLVIIALAISILKQSALPGNTIRFNMIILVLISISALSLLIISIMILVIRNDVMLEMWIALSQLIISILLFGSTYYIREDEKYAAEIRKQELITETEIKQYI